MAYFKCQSCEDAGFGTFIVCGPKCVRKCREQHASGEQPQHGSFKMSTPAKAKMSEAQTKRRQSEKDGPEDSSGDESESDDVAPVSSEHTRSPCLAAKRKRERRAAKEARAKEAEGARKAARKAADEVARMGRAASRSIARD